MAKVTLDLETFKALASTTRLAVLRCLDERRKTLSEMTKELDLNKATVHEHLAILVATGLVKKRDDEGRKWIYYELTWQGERLLHPQDTTTFAVLLGFAVAAAGAGGVALLGKSLEWWLAEKQIQEAGALEETAPDDRQSMSADTADDGDSSSSSSSSTSSGGGSPSSDDSAPAAESDGLDYDNGTHDLGDSADEVAKDMGMDIDPDGVFGVLLLLTGVLLAVLARAMRRRR